jgi:hypothetical protein
MTIMVKHDKGYAPGIGDWEFLVMDGATTKIAKPAQVENCQMCHAPYKRTDFVTRQYLSEDARSQLR